MNFWDKITGNDMTREMKDFEERASKLPDEYKNAWESIKANLWQHSDFTGRNLMPFLDGALGFLEETAAEGQSVNETFGDDINGFCLALVGDEAAKNYRDKWREQLNKSVAKKLEHLGGNKL